jgi:hypothetical protein
MLSTFYGARRNNDLGAFHSEPSGNSVAYTATSPSNYRYFTG